MIKPLAAAAVVVIIISAIAIYVIPKFVYVSPFSSFYASGIVDHKKIGYGTDNNGVKISWYTVSVRLFDDDPVNHIQSGETLAYIVSKIDWDMVASGDTVKIKIFPNAKAEVVELYPTLGPPVWPQLSLKIDLTPSKTVYAVGEDANFTIHITNSPLNPGDTPYNISVSIFKNSFFYIFQDGKIVSINQNFLGTESVILQPSQEVNYTFYFSLTSFLSGTYYVRAYIGYFTDNEELTLAGTTMIYVSE